MLTFQFISDEDIGFNKLQTPGTDQLDKARELRKREKDFERAITFILKYFLFLGILSAVAYGNRNSQSNFYYQNLKRILESPKLYVRFHHVQYEKQRKTEIESDDITLLNFRLAAVVLIFGITWKILQATKRSQTIKEGGSQMMFL